MLVGRSSRRTVISVPEALEPKEERPGFFTRSLARILRRSSVASTASGSLVSGGSLLGVAGAASPAPAPASVVDQEVVFSASSGRCARARAHAVYSASGARASNEDRFRVVSDLELYARALLRATGAPSVGELLAQRALEAFIVRGDAPALATRVSGAAATLLMGERAPAPTQMVGVYDGHGGARCSSLLALLFPLFLMDAPAFEHNLPKACEAASAAMNADLMARAAAGECDGGATAITLLLRERTAVISNTGDCRAILLTRSIPEGAAAAPASPATGRGPARVVQLTTDHKATDEGERQRVEAAGGMILYVKGVARVNGRLAVTRAFGDGDLHGVVVPDPQVVVRELADADEYIVMASDGLWDVMSNEEVAACVRCVLHDDGCAFTSAGMRTNDSMICIPEITRGCRCLKSRACSWTALWSSTAWTT